MFRIASFGKSDRGLKRSNNEDAFLVDESLGINVLADGMGGAAAGELASGIFAQAALEVFSNHHQSAQAGLEAQELLQKVYVLAHSRILKHVKANPEHRGMGCTAELLFLHDDKFSLGHIGDSRTYLYRRGQLKLLTKDHSLVQQQLDQGLISRDQAKVHRYRNVLLRAVGTGEALAVDFLKGKVAPGDMFLLCSDGLTSLVDDGRIQEVLASDPDISAKIDTLIDLAKSAGGHDNVTVILSEVSQ